jgi:MFS family permease
MTHDDRRSSKSPAQGEVAAHRARWFALGVLVLVGVLNYVDRELPYILADSIKADLKLSDTALGFITGLGFLLVYAVMGLPLARLSDRSGAYGLVIGGAVAFWSLMTAVGGVCQNQWQLALARMGVAVGESGSSPAAHAYIARNFEPHRRGLPLALFFMSSPVGAMLGLLGLLGGGYLEAVVGWRGAFLAMGAVGFALTLVVSLTVKGARAVRPPPEPTRQLLGGVRQLLRNRSYRRVVLAAAFSGFATYTIAAFGPALLHREYGMAPREVGATLGVTKGLLGLAVLIAGGFVVDRVGARNPRWMPLVPTITVVCGLPIIMMAWLTDDKIWAIVALATANAVGPACLAPSVSCFQSLSPPHLRATASAFFLFAIAIFGGAGPLVAGALSDMLSPTYGPQSLRQALLLVPAAHIVSALIYWWASRDFQGELYLEEHPAPQPA